MEAGRQYVADPGDVTDTHMDTDWDIQKRAEYELERGPRQPVYSSRKTRRTAHEESENPHHVGDHANH
jgi:hypothetical protein